MSDQRASDTLAGSAPDQRLGCPKGFRRRIRRLVSITATASVMKPPSDMTCQNRCNRSGRMKIEYSATDNTQPVDVAITARTQGSAIGTLVPPTLHLRPGRWTEPNAGVGPLFRVQTPDATAGAATCRLGLLSIMTISPL